MTAAPSTLPCVVTAGPTFEPLDEVRRLTNFSTGRLGTELANFLVDRGWRVILLLGALATHPGPRRAQQIEPFTTTADLRQRLAALAKTSVAAVLHAAAVSDFGFGKIWQRTPDGEWIEVQSPKLPATGGQLLAELVPTPKILHDLRDWFPAARLVGWKYELTGDRSTALRRAEEQIVTARTDACVVNGRAYGAGFGLVRGPGQCLHLPDAPALFAALEAFLRQGR